MLLLLPFESQYFGQMPDMSSFHKCGRPNMVPFLFGPRCLHRPRFQGQQTTWKPCQRNCARGEGAKTPCRVIKQEPQSPVWKTIVNCSGVAPDDINVKVRKGEVFIHIRHEQKDAGNVLDIKQTIPVPHNVDLSTVSCRFHPSGILLLQGRWVKNATEDAKPRTESEMGKTEKQVTITDCSCSPCTKSHSEDMADDNTTCHKGQEEHGAPVDPAPEVEMKNMDETTEKVDTVEKTLSDGGNDAQTVIEQTVEEGSGVQDKGEDERGECEEETSTGLEEVRCGEIREECDECDGDSSTDEVVACCGDPMDEDGEEKSLEEHDFVFLQTAGEADDTRADVEVGEVKADEAKETEEDVYSEHPERLPDDKIQLNITEGIQNKVSTRHTGRDCFSVSFGLQKYKPSEIRVTVQDNVVRVSAERKIRGDNYDGTEKYDRHIYLPDSADPSTVISKLQEDGILIIAASSKANTGEDIIIPVRKDD